MLMEKIEVIKSISKRSGGDIYLGVVGAVRTGKSTFIRKFMENLVIPNIEDEYERKRCLDELPQAAAGKTIMTTEPKFVPNEAVEITIGDNIDLLKQTQLYQAINKWEIQQNKNILLK